MRDTISMIFLGMSREPWKAVLFFVGVVGFIMMVVTQARTYKELDAYRRKEQEAAETSQDGLLQRIESVRQSVSTEIEALAKVADRRLSGNSLENDGLAIQAAFEKIDEAILRHEEEDVRAWVRSVIGHFRAQIRRLIGHVESSEVSSEVARELLAELRLRTLADLKPQVDKLGRVWTRAFAEEGDPQVEAGRGST